MFEKTTFKFGDLWIHSLVPILWFIWFSLHLTYIISSRRKNRDGKQLKENLEIEEKGYIASSSMHGIIIQYHSIIIFYKALILEC